MKLKEKFEKMKVISKELMELKDPMNLELTNQVVYCFNKHRDVMLFLNDFVHQRNELIDSKSIENIYAAVKYIQSI